MNLLSDTNIHLENKKLSRIFFVFLMLMYSLVYMTKQCFAGALAAIVDEGALTLTQASIITASFYIVYAPLQILGGIFADKYSPERLIVIGLVGSAASNVVIFFNQNFWVMLIAWIFSAIVQFALWPSVFKIMSSQLVRSDRPKMVFLMSFTSSAGLVLTYLFAAIVPRWQDNFAISAIILVLLSIALLIFCEKLNPILIKDRIPQKTEGANSSQSLDEKKKWKIFISSGFVAVLISTPFRVMVENSGKTMTPTMLSQSYENISPSIGNLLNILIILAGMLAIVLSKTIVIKFIKNELVGFLVVLLISLPITIVLRFVGTIPVWAVVTSLCLQSMFLSATTLLGSIFNMRFTKYGLNGTAAGLLNCMQSLGIVIQYCLFGTIAESFGWQIVTTLWIIMIIIAILCTVFGLRSSNRFIKNEINK